ncbi:uncharacterized protein [Diabrotica undecimpunctata]|uniref:uncharacterized protein n=1 Tax=Diabrotica undecimpunctata TaxID=50387 RepID=UPI003B632D88
MKTGVIVIFVVFCFCKADLTDQSIDHPEGGPVPTVITHINTTNTDGHLLLSTINILDPKADSSLNNTISSQSSMPAPPNDLINRPLKGPIDKELNKGNNTFNTSTNDIKINILNSGLEAQGTAGSHSSEKAAVEKNKSEVPKDGVISENNAKLGHDLKFVGINKSISPKTNEIVLENASTTKFSVETTTEPTTLVTTNIVTDSTIPTITTDFTTPDNTYVTPSTYTETETTYSPYSTNEPTTITAYSITLGVNISGSTDMPTFTNRLGSNTTTHDAVTTSTHHHRNGTHKSSTHRYHKHTPVSSTESTGHSYHRFNKYTNHHYGTKRTHTATTSSGHHRFKPTHKRTYIHNRFSDTTETTETSPNSTNISNNNVTTVTSTTSRYHRYKPVHKNQHSYHRYNKINTINDTALNNTNLEVNGTTAAPVTHTTHRYHRYKPVHKTHYSHRQYSHIKRKSHVNNDTKINSTNSEDNTETTTISAHRYHTYKPIHKTHHNYHSSHHIRTTENILNGSTTEASNNGDNNTETTTMSVISSSTHRYHRFHPKTNIYNSKNIQRSHNKPSGSYFYTTRHHSHIEQGNDGDYTTTEMPIKKNIYQKYRYRNHFSNNFLNRPSSTDNPNSTSSNTITPNTTTSSLPLEKTDNPNSTISETSTSVYERFRHNRPNFLNSRFGTVNNHIEIHHSNISSEQNAINSNGTKTEEPNINPEEDSGTDTTTEISSTYAYDRYKRMRHRMSFKPHFTVSKHVHPSESNTSESMGNETTTIRPISRTNIYQRYRNVHRPMQMKPLVQVNHKETTVTDDEATVSEHTTQPGITAEITSVYDRYRTFRHRMNFKPHVETSKGTTQTHSNTSEPSPTESIGNEITTQEPTESTSVYERFRHAHRPRLMRPLVQVRHQETTTLDSTQTLSNSSEPNSTDSFGNEITTQEPTVSTSVYERFRHLRRPMRIRPLMQARHEETTTIDTTDTTEIHLNPSEYIPTDRFGNEITTQEPTARTSVYERFRQAHRPMRMRPLIQARHEETTTLDTTDTTQIHLNPSESIPTDSYGNEITTQEPTASTSVYERFRHAHRPMRMRPLVQARHEETTTLDTTDTTQIHLNPSESIPTDRYGNEITTQEPTASTSLYERYRHGHRPMRMRPLMQARHEETTTLDTTDTTQIHLNPSESIPTDSYGNEITTQEPTASTSVYERFRHAHRPMRMRPLMQARHEETTTLDTTDTTQIHLNPSESIPTDSYGNEITTQEPTASTSVYERFRHAHRPMRMRPLVQARHEETTTLDTTDTTQIHLNPSESISTDRYGNEITTQEPTASSSVYERFRHAHRPMRMRPLVQARHEEITTLDTTDTTQIHLNPSESIPTDRYGNEITTQEPTASTSVYERFRHASRPVHMRPLMQVRHKETTTSDITDTTDSTTEVTITTDTTDVTSLYDRYRKFRNIHRPVHMKPIITTVVPNTSETTYDLQDNESSAITDATTNIAETNRPRIHMRPRISQVNHNEFSAHSQHPKRMRYNRHLYDRRPLSQHKTIIKDDINENAETTLAPELSGNEHTDNRQRHLNQRSFSENEDDDSVNSVPTREVMVDHDTNYHQPIHMRPRYLAIHRRPSDANENYDESDLDPEESGYKVRRRVHNRHLRRRSQHYYTESDPPEFYGAYGKNIPEGRNNDGIPPKFQNQISQNLATKTDSIGVMYEEDPVGHDHEGHVKVKHSISDSEYFNSLESDDSFQVNPLRADASASESIINREDRDTFGTNTSNIVLNNEENNASNTKIRQNGSLSENTSEHKGDDRVSFGLGDTLFADEASDDLLFEAEDHVGSDLFGDAVEPTISPFEKVTVSLPKSFYSSSLDDVSEEANNQTSLKKTNNTIKKAPKNSEDNEELMKESNISGLSETELHQMQKYIDERKSITDEETTEQQLVTVDPKHWYTLSYHQDTSDSNEVDSETTLKSETTPKSETTSKSETTPKPIIITEELVSSVTNEIQNFTTENILIKDKIESITVTETTATTEAGITENKVIYFTMPYEDNNNSSEMNTKSKTIEKGYSLEELGMENIGIKSIIDVSTEPSTISTTDNVQIGTSGLFLFTDNKTEQTELPVHKNKTTKGENITVEELNITNIEPVNSNNKSAENHSNINESRTEMTVQLTTELNIFNSKNNTENNKNETTVIDNAKDTSNHDNNKIELIPNNTIKIFTEEPATNGIETVKILERMGTEDKVKESDILVKQKQNDSSSNSSIENKKDDSSSNSSIQNKKDSISTNSLKEISTEANLDAETTTESGRNSTTVSLTESNVLSLATTNQTVVQESHPFIVTNIFGHKSNFTAQLQIQNSSDYLPSDVNVTEDAINQVLNFTWSPYEAVVNTISLNLRKVSKHYVIDGLQLYLVKDGNVSVWTKNEIQPQKDEVSKQLCLEIEKGIRVMFSNLDFLTAEEDESILADKHQVEAAEKSDMKIMSIEIIGGVGVLLCAVFVAMIVSYRIIKMKKRGKATLNTRV